MYQMSGGLVHSAPHIAGLAERAGAGVGAACQSAQPGEELAARAEAVRRKVRRGRNPVREHAVVDENIQRSRFCVEAYHVAILDPADHASVERFWRDV